MSFVFGTLFRNSEENPKHFVRDDITIHVIWGEKSAILKNSHNLIQKSPKRNQLSMTFLCVFWAQKPKNTRKSQKLMSFWHLFRLNFEDKGAISAIFLDKSGVSTLSTLISSVFDTLQFIVQAWRMYQMTPNCLLLYGVSWVITQLSMVYYPI